ncbi:MAG: C39 family peptidase [Gemmatimonadales bacterium]|nr:C39 family peptidase [Gemmatimonadales bacterium]
MPCYELRGQLTGVWCVAASVQMILDFYRYNYDQARIAQDLGLGTLNNPNGLPYSQDGQVVTVLEDLTDDALDATMNTSPTWAEFVAEINANRPLVSFVPGHSRTVAGYTRGPSVLGNTFRGLLVYDPWPPSPSTPPTPTTGGVITRWENFDAHTYRRTFTAVLQLV